MQRTSPEPRRVSRVLEALVLACLLVPSTACLVGSGIVTGNLGTIYLEDVENHVVIEGRTALATDLEPFEVDDPIPFDGTKTIDDDGFELEVEFQRYTNASGDALEFQREYDPDAERYWEWVWIHPRSGAAYKLQRLDGYVGNGRARAVGFTFGAE